jgi:peptidoglycan/LPS O-acetylase OafA/YrhL
MGCGSMTGQKIDALTGIRGIAAWLVVLYHIRTGMADSLPAPVMAILAKGYLAVDLFFVLSGFVLWLTWGQRFGTGGLSLTLEFMRKRLARVWPLHAAILGATVGFAAILAATGRPLPPHFRWDELPLHIILVQNWGFTVDLGWNDPSWSISTEFAAYLCFPVAAVALARVRLAPWAAVLVATGSILALDRIFAAAGGALLGHDIARLGLVRCLVEFACGMLTCVVWQQSRGRALPGLALGLFLTAIIGWTAGWVREPLAIPIAFCALVLLIAESSGWRGNPLSSRAAVWLGEISYSTYLAHFLLWTVFKIAFVADPAAVSPILALVYLALTLTASAFLYRFVELPGRKWGTPAKCTGSQQGNLAPR